MSKVEFNDRVAIVTGAGAGLGKLYAMELARRGVKVVVNDFGGSRDGTGGSATVAEQVVAEIEAAGGEAMAAGCSVTDMPAVQKVVDDAIAKWGHVDILVNNAGVLRDKSFHKMPIEDFHFVLDVHLIGSLNCTKAVWNHMREREYGRIVMTTSSSGMYGNFGQVNYGAAKTALVGMMNSLHLEGVRKNIHVNCISPAAATRMTEDIMPEEALAMMGPEAVVPAVVYLCNDNAPSKTILTAAAGGYAAAKILETEGIWLPAEERNAESIAANIDNILNETGMQEYTDGSKQVEKFFRRMQEVTKA